MSAKTCSLRPYLRRRRGRGNRALAAHWSKHYPHIDFNARVAWWCERWRNELVPVARINGGEVDSALAGFVTVGPKTMYLDQIVVAPEYWGSTVALVLLDEAKRLSPKGLELLVNKDNFRAIGFYEARLRLSPVKTRAGVGDSQ